MVALSVSVGDGESKRLTRRFVQRLEPLHCVAHETPKKADST
jgi:hypothetical protein